MHFRLDQKDKHSELSRLIPENAAQNPLVTVICLCYNQGRFVEEAIQSVFMQSYPNIELIVVDDASTDNSVEVIHQVLAEHPEAIFICNETNEGNCRSFNKALKLTKGTYVIDLAADDVMLPDRVEEQVKAFQKLPSDYGVVFSNSIHIDESGTRLGSHFKTDRNGKSLSSIPTGDLYALLVERFFVSPPTMMVRREVLELLEGYDETLAYEDFDFWVRSSRLFKYFYVDKLLMKKRSVHGSLSSKQYALKSKIYAESTLAVCRKIKTMNRNEAENRALRRRSSRELRTAFFCGCFDTAQAFFELKKELGSLSFSDRIFRFMAQRQWLFFRFYRVYLKIKGKRY